MRRSLVITLVLTTALIASCAKRSTTTTVKPTGTLAQLRDMKPDVREMKVDQGLDTAMMQYRRFLEDAPVNSMTPDAIRRLADLQIEKQFGIHTPGIKPREMTAPVPAAALPPSASAAASDAARESDSDFEKRTTAGDAPDAIRKDVDPKAALEAIDLYDRLLTDYPSYEQKDQVLYQKARAFDELGRTEEAMATMELLIRDNPKSEHLDEVQYRRGEYFFTRRKFRDAENAYTT